MRKLEDDWYTKENQLQTAHTLELQTKYDTLLQDHATAMATAIDEDTRAAIEPVPPLVLTEKDIIRDFIAYWTKHLARLHQDAPPKSRANIVTAAKVDELRTQIGDLITDQQTLAQAYNAVIQQPPPHIPSVVSTNPGSSLTPQQTLAVQKSSGAFNAQQQQQIAAAVAAALENRPSTTPPSNPG